MSDDLLERLRGFEKAYPKSVFVSLTRELCKRLHEKEPGLQDCIAADMARHLVEMAITPAADEIEALRTELAAKDAKIQRLESRGISDMQQELKEKDKRIEELQRLLRPLAGSYHGILPEHVDDARGYFSRRALDGEEVSDAD